MDQRLSAEQRRTAIVKAALPLFARKGFANTTSRDLAEAAGVSEALIYKHFPSKESLYAEIQNFGCQGATSAFEKIESLEPSSSSLVRVLYILMRSLAIDKSKDLLGWETRHRLVLHSCLEDGAFPRYLFNNHFRVCFEKIVACLAAAEAAGELIRSPISKQNRVLFAQHLACMIAI